MTKKADYVIGLKVDQAGLHEQVADWFERIKPTLPAHVSRDLGHGRDGKRIVWLSEHLTLVDASLEWVGIRDVTFDEDGSRVRKDHAPLNLTIMRKLALGLISREPLITKTEESCPR